MARGPFRVSVDYVYWAHGPGAESAGDGYEAARELCGLADAAGDRPLATVPAEREDLVTEIASVAELYVGGEPGDTDPRAARVLQRARQWLEAGREFT
jgi:hypothetical protein